MIPQDTLTSFTSWEDRQYSLQATLQHSRLHGAADALDLYSCHSQPHVLEVMEQCSLLLPAFLPWLRRELPGTDEEWLRDHLLLSAKLHDIGMCGSEGQRLLLNAADEAHTLLSAHAAPDAQLLDPLLSVLQQEAPLAHLPPESWQSLPALAQSGQLPPLLSALTRLHEAVKSAIRRQHAHRSGVVILRHAEEIRAHYGAQIDVAAVAALAALHSSSSLQDACIVPDGAMGEQIRAHVYALVADGLSEAEAARITAPLPFLRICLLAAILRLSDTRRSGSRLMSMDQSHLRCEVTSEGNVTLSRLHGGIREPIPQRIAFDILTGEALTEFGPVTVHPTSDGGWHIRHEMTLRHAEVPAICDVFARSRLRSYAEEIDTGALLYARGFTHEIFLHLEGLRPIAAARTARRWRSDVPWLKDSPLQITVL